jgi:hypothetical protein
MRSALATVPWRSSETVSMPTGRRRGGARSPESRAAAAPRRQTPGRCAARTGQSSPAPTSTGTRRSAAAARRARRARSDPSPPAAHRARRLAAPIPLAAAKRPGHQLRANSLRVHRIERDDGADQASKRLQQLPHHGDLVRFHVRGHLAQDRAGTVRQDRDQVRGLPILAPRRGLSLPSIAITRRPQTRAALVYSHAPETRSSASALTSANARRNVDASADPRNAPRTARTSGQALAAHCPIAANDRDPAIPTVSNPASGCRRPRLFHGSGTWASRSSRYWLHAAVIGEGVIGGRVPRCDGQCRNCHRCARVPPAASGHAGHINRPYDLRHRRSQPHITTLPCPCPDGGAGRSWSLTSLPCRTECANTRQKDPGGRGTAIG